MVGIESLLAGFVERARGAVAGRVRGARAATGGAESDRGWTDAAVNAALAFSLLLAAVSVPFALAQPDGEFTEFSLLTRDDSGDLVAGGYPRELERGESAPVVLGVTNRERAITRYTVVVRAQRVRPDENRTDVDAVGPGDRNRREVTVAPGRTRFVPYDVSPAVTGRNVRVSFLLYRGDVPSEPTTENAYRELHLWVAVSANASEAAPEAG